MIRSPSEPHDTKGEAATYQAFGCQQTRIIVRAEHIYRMSKEYNLMTQERLPALGTGYVILKYSSM